MNLLRLNLDQFQLLLLLSTLYIIHFLFLTVIIKCSPNLLGCLSDQNFVFLD